MSNKTLIKDKDLNLDLISSIKENSIVKGKVVYISKTEVFVDIGYKSDGIISRKEFTDINNQENVKIGDDVYVYLEKKEDANGFVVLSKRKADELLLWEKCEKAYDTKENVKGRIIREIRSGFLVDLGGIVAFLPSSQISIKNNRNTYINKILKFKIMKINRRKNNIILSHKMQVAEEINSQKMELWNSLKEREIISGTVKTLVPYGAFVDIGGIDGLLHVNDMSWSKINDPEEIVKVGDKIEAMILKIDKESKKLSLGIKQKIKDPWEGITEKYPIGTKVIVKVVNLLDYGAFVKLEEGVEGLIHISEMSWTKRPKHPSNILAIGDNIEAVVLHIDVENRKLSFGIKQLEPDPWSKIEETYKIGEKVKGVVKGFAEFGVFVELPDGIEGLLHISEMSWTKKIRRPSEVLKRGEKIEVMILKISKEQKKISLGLKQLTPDPWIDEIPQVFKPGTVIKGKVSKIANFGVFVELTNGVEGLLHVSDMPEHSKDILKKKFNVGDEHTFIVITLDTEKRKIRLALEDTGE